MSRLNMNHKLSLHEFEKCACCSQVEITKKSITMVTEPLELIHFDLCEIDSMLIRNNKMYFGTFIDDFSDFIFIYLLKNKSDASNMFKVFAIEV